MYTRPTGQTPLMLTEEGKRLRSEWYQKWIRGEAEPVEPLKPEDVGPQNPISMLPIQESDPMQGMF